MTDRTEQRNRLRQRLEAKYPDLQLTDTQLNNYLDAQDRMQGQPTKGRAEVGRVEMRRAGPESAEDILDFFDNRAFANNPGWASCYCIYHHLGQDAEPRWEDRSWQDNRDELRTRIESGSMRAFLAYEGNQVVGWCNASDRGEFPEHATGDDEGVASLVCFTVAPTHRGYGIGAQLLDAAMSELPSDGVELAEAYPVPDHVEDASAYHGRVKLFKKAGFVESEDAQSEKVQRRF
ncbi:MAG: GNAT family N-acetyltransferase [Acidimicrobiia bacterium]